MKLTSKIRVIKVALMTALVAVFTASCSEEIDMSNRYTFTEETVMSYLEKHEQFSEYVRLLKEVPINPIDTNKVSFRVSTVGQLLSARGNFTCFAPNNNAIQLYLDSLYRKDIIDNPSWDGFRNQNDLDSIKRVIVYNSIIDGGNVEYYETASFPEHNNDEFPFSNMNDRRLSVVRPDSKNPDIILINGTDSISLKNRDIEAINGRIHEMLSVIAPSNESLTNIMQKWITDGGSSYIVTAKLIMACGLADTLSKYRDEVWEELYMTGKVEDIGNFKGDADSGKAPEHRKYGFTIFAETDDVWEAALGKSAEDITVEDVRNYISSNGLYSSAVDDDNYKSEDNLLNQFVTYHILPMRISPDKLIVHYNETGYNYKIATATPTVATEEFYTTMGKRRLLKVYESAESEGIYLNRFPVLRNGRGDYSVENLNINDYHESGTFQAISGHALTPNENEGIHIDTESSNENAGQTTSTINGIIYPINKILVLSENVTTQLQRQRIRFDLASMLPELMSNDLRRPLKPYPTLHSQYRGFPTSYQYFDNIEIKEGTRFYYLNGLDFNWFNWQGDEFNIKGRYEFIIKLPPVPKDGHYELRLAVQSNSNLRGMCQVYWGPDKNNLPAIGIPLDMRMGGEKRHLSNMDQPSIVGWEKDTGDPEYDDEVDKRMRNNGFMKGPKHYSAVPGSAETIRDKSDAIRRIMVSEEMKADKTYYIKFKSVLDDVEKEFYIDYIEYCAKEVYDNPVEAEDIW